MAEWRYSAGGTAQPGRRAGWPPFALGGRRHRSARDEGAATSDLRGRALVRYL